MADRANWVPIPVGADQPMDNNSNGGDTRDNAVLIAIEADRVSLKTGTSAAVSLLSPHTDA